MRWYLTSSKTDDKYLKKVSEIVSPTMDYLCDKLYEIDYKGDLSESHIIECFDEIICELPILKLDKINDELVIRYNSYTHIKFTDTFKSLKRDIVISKLLE